MTMHAEYVRTGAAATRRASTKNPMEMLSRLRERYPTGSFEDLFAKWRKDVERDAEANTAALLHSFRNYWTSLDRDNRAKPEPKSPEDWAAEREQRETEKAAEREELKQRFTQFIFLEMVLPICGKRLKDATFAECSTEGGLLSKIGKMGKPNQIVGKTVTEEQLRRL
jgi:hypothetical protein